MIEAVIGVRREDADEYIQTFDTIEQAKRYLSEAHKAGDIDFLDDYVIEIELTKTYSEYITLRWGDGWTANIGK